MHNIIGVSACLTECCQLCLKQTHVERSLIAVLYTYEMVLRTQPADSSPKQFVDVFSNAVVAQASVNTFPGSS